MVSNLLVRTAVQSWFTAPFGSWNQRLEKNKVNLINSQCCKNERAPNILPMMIFGERVKESGQALRNPCHRPVLMAVLLPREGLFCLGTPACGATVLHWAHVVLCCPSLSFTDLPFLLPMWRLSPVAFLATPWKDSAKRDLEISQGRPKNEPLFGMNATWSKSEEDSFLQCQSPISRKHVAV